LQAQKGRGTGYRGHQRGRVVRTRRQIARGEGAAAAGGSAYPGLSAPQIALVAACSQSLTSPLSRGPISLHTLAWKAFSQARSASVSMAFSIRRVSIGARVMVSNSR